MKRHPAYLSPGKRRSKPKRSPPNGLIQSTKLAKRIKQIRGERRIEDLAVSAGVSKTRWYDVENGANCSYWFLTMIAKALGVGLRELIPE